MLRSLVQNAQIWFTFWSYNDAARKAWRKAAEAKWPTANLKNDLHDRIRQLEGDAERKYGVEIRRQESELAEARKRLADLQAKLVYFETNYREEIDRAYGRLNEIKAEQATCRDELSEAYSDLEAAKDGIDRWYAKSDRSTVLFGNRGKRLPKHSVFGQSFGDLESLKAERDAAGEAIGELKAERERLNDEFGELRQKIERLKRDRDVWFRLKEEGHSRGRLTHSIEMARGEIADLELQVRRQGEYRDRYVASERLSRGIAELESQIADIETRRRQMIEQFDEPGELEKRKAAHRREWLAAHPSRSSGGGGWF